LVGREAAFRDRWAEDRRRRRWPFAVAAGAVLLVVAAAGFHELKTRRLLSRAAALAVAGDEVHAREAFARAEGRRWHRGEAGEGLAVVDLLAGREAQASAGLVRAKAAQSRRSPYALDELFARWLDAGDYAPMAVYANYLRERDPKSVAVSFWAGVAADGLGQLKEARELLSGGPMKAVAQAFVRGREALLGPPFKEPSAREVYKRHVKLVDEGRKSGKRALVVDAKGKALLQRVLASGELVAADPALAAVLVGADGKGGLLRALDARDRLNLVDTNLDLELTRRLGRMLKGHEAAAVVLDAEARIIAVAMSAAPPRRVRARGGDEEAVPAPDPLADAVELASVVKLVTFAAALDQPYVLDRVFPFRCDKPLKLGDGPFYDWRPHGDVGDARRALAMSCNLAFARLGMELGGDSLKAALGRFGFDCVPSPAALGVSFGKVELRASTPRELAGLGSGTAPVKTSLAHAAGMALTIARGGEFIEPQLVSQRETLGGHVYAKAPAARWRALSEAAAREIARGMREVVEDADGTAHNAAMDGVSLAAKTGSFGHQGQRGLASLDGLIVGYVPAESPRFAWAILVRGEGLASGTAAVLSHSLVDALVHPEGAR